MLVLTRRPGEQIVLPGVAVRFTLLSVAGGRIRIGVEAPREVEVIRGELQAPVLAGSTAVSNSEVCNESS